MMRPFRSVFITSEYEIVQEDDGGSSVVAVIDLDDLLSEMGMLIRCYGLSDVPMTKDAQELRDVTLEFLRENGLVPSGEPTGLPDPKAVAERYADLPEDEAADAMAQEFSPAERSRIVRDELRACARRYDALRRMNERSQGGRT